MCNSNPLAIANIADASKLCKETSVNFSSSMEAFRRDFFTNALMELQRSINDLVQENNDLGHDNTVLKNRSSR